MSSPNMAGPYGNNNGTTDGPGTIDHKTAVSQIIAYASSTYIYGIKLYWGANNSVMYGSTNGLSGETLELTDDPVKEIKCHVDATGVLRGMRFKTMSGTVFAIGYLNTDRITVFSNDNAVFTDLQTYKGTANSSVVIWGVTVYFTGPTTTEEESSNDTAGTAASSHCACTAAELAWPALGILAHTTVVIKSFMKVGETRKKLGIHPPSCEPSLTTSPSDSQLWYRTFRAQENCKEMFLVYLPSILIASTMGHHAFGKWAPRTVGTLSLIGACFRFKYLNAYIEDADKRGQPFYWANFCMRPIFFMAVASAGYLIGKEIYCCVKHSLHKKEEKEE